MDNKEILERIEGISLATNETIVEMLGDYKESIKGYKLLAYMCLLVVVIQSLMLMAK